MDKKIEPAEFYDVAAQVGFYGLEKGGLTGKKDYVRKYWEDIVIKSKIRNRAKHNSLRCTAGEQAQCIF